MLNTGDAQSEAVVDAAHPLRIAPGKVVVDRNDMNALLREGIERHRRGRRKRLAFTGAHFGDLALVQHHAAHELNIEVALAKSAPCGFSHAARMLRGADLPGFRLRCIVP